MEFKELPVLHNRKGAVRTVGFEIEFANVGIEESVQLIQDLYGGQPEGQQRFSRKVVNTRLGDFSIEFDLTLLTEKGYRKVFDKFNINPQEVVLGGKTLEQEVETMLESVVGMVIPYEISTPPVPATQIQEFEALRLALYEHSAKGTGAFPTNAFGLHINVETPAPDAETLLAYIRSVLVLYPWLVQHGETDLARRLSPFINPFPGAYAELVLPPSYSPDLFTLVEDYHRHNPDRNRPLDMYPLFAALVPDKIGEYPNIGKVKARETYHYRLPNSSVCSKNWSLAQEWNHWVVVEELASDPGRLREMSEAYLALKFNTLLGFDSKWLKQTEKWLP